MSNTTPRAEEIFEKGSKTFYNATRFFPDAVKADITNLYAFVRIADQYVDTVPAKPLELKLMKQALLEARTGLLVQDDIVARFVELETRVGFEPAWADAFLQSMEDDLSKKIYNTEKEMRNYCYGSAAVIGLFVSAIVGSPTESYPHAEALGNAFQFINMIRDIQEDYKDLGRTYIPADEIKACGLANLSKQATEANPEGFKKLMQIQIARYQAEQQKGLAGIHFLPIKTRAAILTAAEMYNWTALEILKDPFVIYRKKVKPSKLRIVLTGLKHRVSTKATFSTTPSFAQTEETKYTTYN